MAYIRAKEANLQGVQFYHWNHLECFIYRLYLVLRWEWLSKQYTTKLCWTLFDLLPSLHAFSKCSCGHHRLAAICMQWAGHIRPYSVASGRKFWGIHKRVAISFQGAGKYSRNVSEDTKKCQGQLPLRSVMILTCYDDVVILSWSLRFLVMLYHRVTNILYIYILYRIYVYIYIYNYTLPYLTNLNQYFLIDSHEGALYSNEKVAPSCPWRHMKVKVLIKLLLPTRWFLYKAIPMFDNVTGFGCFGCRELLLVLGWTNPLLHTAA